MGPAAVGSGSVRSYDPSAETLSAGRWAERSISRAYRRVVRGGVAITTDSPATDLHALRKRCKETSPPKGPQDCRRRASSIQSADDPCVSETRISPGDIARLLHEAETSEVPLCVRPSQRHIHRADLTGSSPVRPTPPAPAVAGARLQNPVALM
jgi:hypothetical protein